MNTNEHNPDGLTPEQVGEGWRLLRVGETIATGDEWRDCVRLKWAEAIRTMGQVLAVEDSAYRRRIAPTNPAQSAAMEGEKETVAMLTAHRACCGEEHDPANGKIHGFCVVCGIPWPCEIAKGSRTASLERRVAELTEENERTQKFRKHAEKRRDDYFAEMQRRGVEVDALRAEVERLKGLLDDGKGQSAVSMLYQEVERLTTVLRNLMPFVLEEYYPDCATSEYKAAVESAIALTGISKPIAEDQP